MAKESKRKKRPTIKTLKDKGTKIDFVDFGDGRQIFVFQEEKFRGVNIGGVKLGMTDKFKVISPEELTQNTVTIMSHSISKVSNSYVTPNDILVIVGEEEKKPKEKSEK